MRVDAIINCRAKHLGQGSRLAQVVSDELPESHVFLSKNLDELRSSLQSVLARGTDAIAFAGGDGSIMHGLSALYGLAPDVWPSIVLLPGGTMNTIARNWGFRGPKRLYFRRVLRAAARGSGQVIARSLVRVETDKERMCGCIVATGLVTGFFREYNASSRGPLAALSLATELSLGALRRQERAVRVLQAAEGHLELNGSRLPGQTFTLVVAGTVKNVGLHFHLLHRASSSAPLFHVVGSSEPPNALARQVPRVLLGLPLEGGRTIDRVASSLKLTFSSGSGEFILDGEIFRSARMEVHAGPTIRQIAP